jgi:hypothetical protein
MIHNLPENIQTTENDWWFLFNLNSLELITKPQQCSGYTSSLYSMFIGNSLEECENYINDNGILNNLPDYEQSSLDN